MKPGLNVWGGITVASLAALSPATAAGQDHPAAPTTALEQRLTNLAATVQAQQAQIDAQKIALAAQEEELARLKAQIPPDLASARGAGVAQTQPAGSQATQPTAGESIAPKPDIADRVEAVPQGQGVLTPAGRTTIQSSLTYIRAATNRLVFAGIELVPGLQIGSIQAATADRNTTIDSLTVWHGFSDRLEGELMVPVLIRTDTIGLSQVRNGTVTEGFRLHQSGLGDIEGALRWQINAPANPDVPIVVASLRVKSDTGISPFGIAYDSFGIAEGLATGSGFWGVQPGLTFLLPSDPAVIYGGVSYLYQIPRRFNRLVNTTLIGEVKPGGAISANVGFGFALNPRFSFSLGYSHTYVLPTSTELDGSIQRSTSLQVGALDLGMSYRLNPHQTVNLAFQFGVTQDAPNVAITLRLPFTF